MLYHAITKKACCSHAPTLSWHQPRTWTVVLITAPALYVATILPVESLPPADIISVGTGVNRQARLWSCKGC